MLSTKLKEAAGNSADATLYVDDVFSTYLYTGNGSTQTITNGIDLAGKGGLVWVKSRTDVSATPVDHALFDTVRGVSNRLQTSTTAAEFYQAGAYVNAFNVDGFSVGAQSSTGSNTYPYASWTFRKAAKFFDVVTWTGDGATIRTLSHNLGIAPGMIFIKRLDTSSNWIVWSTGFSTSGDTLWLNSTNAVSGTSGNGTNGYIIPGPNPVLNFKFANGTTSGSAVNASGGTYVAYLFAHDTSSTGIIQCGNYTGNGSATGPVVTLGWEPQYLMIKNASGTGNWQVIDSMRGMPVGSADATLQANSVAAESSVEYLSPTATGFQITSTNTQVNTSGSTYIYMAIRRPNKPPTTGTQVFSPIATTSATGTKLTTDFVVDAQIFAGRNIAGHNTVDMSRLTGVSTNATESGNNLITNTTDAEAANNFSLAWDNTGFKICSGFGGGNVIYWNFQRAPGFFDVVCYKGTGVNATQAHNLTVAPELMIIKSRSNFVDWVVGNTSLGFAKFLMLNKSDASISSSNMFNNTAPTASVFSIGINSGTNEVNLTYVAYLFATLAGISKVGSYTGNGTSQNIECGFAAGARFFLVKATSTTGSWWVWDSARGITAGNDPALQLNSTAAEITTADAVDPYSPGITVNQEATCSINASGVSYIFLAVA